MSRVIAPPICAVTRTFWSRCRGGTKGSRLRKAAVASACDATSAGTLPHSATTTRPARNAMTRDVPSSPMSSILGNPAGPNATMNLITPSASSRPRPLAMAHRLTVSARSCRTSRDRPAPSAARTDELAPPAGGTCNQQAAGVRAGNREQRQHGAESKPQTTTGAHTDDVIDEGADSDVEILDSPDSRRAGARRGAPSPFWPRRCQRPASAGR